MRTADLTKKWRDRGEEMRRLHALVDGSILCEEIIQDLREVQNETDDELLTLRSAAELSGYSAGHLGRLLRSGALENQGRKFSPLIRKADLPRKVSASVAQGQRPGYNPITDARSLKARR